MKRVFLVMILINAFIFNYVEAKVSGEHFADIIRYIISKADNSNRSEFEAAKQAFLNIQSAGIANRAARDISSKWKASFPEADVNTLKALVRYPNMTAADVKAAGEKLFKDHEGFINGAGEGQLNMGCRIP